MSDFHKFSKGEQIQHQLRTFLEIVDNIEHNRSSLIILKGYIHIFEDTCTTQDCDLKRYREEINQGKISHTNLLLHAQHLYQLGINRFPSCTSLRVSFAFFLLERLNDKRRALIELTNAEKFFPSFDEQFIIFR